MDFDIDKFKLLYPAFADLDDEVIEAFAEQAICYMNKCGKCQSQAWFLAVAHMLALRESTSSGGATGVVQSARRGSESVSFAVGDVSHGRGWWMTTPYGNQYLTLMSRCHGVKYVAGIPPLKR